MSKEEKDTSLVEVNDRSRGLLPSVEQFSIMEKTASYLYNAKFFPDAIKSKEQAVAVMLTGYELGLPLMESIRQIHIIKGRPTLSADLMLSMIRKRLPEAEIIFKETSKQKCIIWTRRNKKDNFTEISWTYDEAVQAGLTTKDGSLFLKYPKDMLRSRAVSRMARTMYNDVITGFYTPEEVKEFGTTDLEPTEEDRQSVKEVKVNNASKEVNVEVTVENKNEDNPSKPKPKVVQVMERVRPIEPKDVVEVPKTNGNGKIKVWDSTDENKNKILAASVEVERVTDKAVAFKGLGFFPKAWINTIITEKDIGQTIGVGFKAAGITKLTTELKDKIEFDEGHVPDEDEIEIVKEWVEVVPKSRHAEFLMDLEEAENQGFMGNRDEYAEIWIKEKGDKK